MPASLKLLWTYEAGDAIESSAAIADGTVFVGSQTGELHAVNLADGASKWKYKASVDGIGESSPAVAGGLVYIGDLSGTLHAVDAASGKAAWTFKTGTEIKSSPVVTGDKVLIGSYDAYLYALGAKDGKVLWKVRTNGYVHGTPAVVDGVAYIAGCDEILRAIRVNDGKELFNISSGAYTGASPAVLDGRAYYGTYENEVLAVDLKAHRIVWRYKNPERNFPFYSSAAIADGKVILGGQRQDRARDRPEDGKAAMDVHHASARGFVAGHIRRSRLHRRQRWEALRARCLVWEKGVRVRSRRSTVRLPRPGVGEAGDWISGR